MIEHFVAPLILVGLMIGLFAIAIISPGDDSLGKYKYIFGITFTVISATCLLLMLNLLYCSYTEYEMIDRPIHKIKIREAEKQYVVINNGLVGIDCNILDDSIKLRQYKPFRWMFIEFDAKEVYK